MSRFDGLVRVFESVWRSVGFVVRDLAPWVIRAVVGWLLARTTDTGGTPTVPCRSCPFQPPGAATPTPTRPRPTPRPARRQLDPPEPVAPPTEPVAPPTEPMPLHPEPIPHRPEPASHRDKPASYHGEPVSHRDMTTSRRDKTASLNRDSGSRHAEPALVLLAFLFAVLAVVFGAGCAPASTYVQAERATFDAVAPEYAAYVTADPVLDPARRDRRLRTIDAWRLRLDKAEAASR